MIRMILIGLVLMIGGFVNPPEPDNECITEWTPMWEFENSRYCDGGHYELWSCEIQRYSNYMKDWYTTLKLGSTCGIIGKPITQPEVTHDPIFLPLVWR